MSASLHMPRFLAAICLALLVLGGEVRAQTASEITPQDFAPPLQRLDGTIVFTGQAGTTAPPGSERIGITLAGVRLENGLPQMAAAEKAFVARLTRGRIPVSELFDATADLEAAYADAGFVLSRVVLPQQSLRDGGTLRVVVVNGFVEDIDIENVPENIRRRVELLTSPLVNRPGLTRAELERQLLLAGDIPGTAMRSALASGQAQGATVIGIDPEYRRVTGFVGFGNPTGSELGGLSLNSGVELNSPFGFGETFYARLSAAPQDALSANPRSRILAFGAAVPVGRRGLIVNAELTFSDTAPDSATLPTRSSFDRQSIRVLYPFIRSRTLNVTGQAALDLQQDDQRLIGGAAIYSDRLTVLRLGATATYLHEDNAFSQAAVFVSRGIDALGARTLADVGGGTPLSRAGADAEFTKVLASVAHRRALSDRLSFSVSARAQTSFGDPLLTSEQFSLVGGSELSSFDSGSLRGDSGWVVRAELSTQFKTDVGQVPLNVSPYAFAAFGMAKLENPTAVEQAQTNASSFGIGVDIASANNSNFRSSSMRIEYGIGKRNDGLPDENRISISGTFRF
ncbi:MAG: ShlB/FhaC/HecB family hemolysin secretion/activation protein [Pseudooceanicola sp.]